MRFEVDLIKVGNIFYKILKKYFNFYLFVILVSLHTCFRLDRYTFQHGITYNIFNIYNDNGAVSDALKMLMFFINTPGQIHRNNNEYTGKSKLADLYIYDDGTPMRFVIV